MYIHDLSKYDLRMQNNSYDGVIYPLPEMVVQCARKYGISDYGSSKTGTHGSPAAINKKALYVAGTARKS